MDVQDIFIMEEILSHALENSGVVRPVDIERKSSQCGANHSSYKIRKVFKAMYQAGMLYFNHTHYIVTAENQMNFLTTDAAKVANGESV